MRLGGFGVCLVLLLLGPNQLSISQDSPNTTARDESEPKRAPRKWTDSTGKYSTFAEFMSLDDDGVVALVKTIGRVVHVPLDRLSDRDQAVVEYYTTKKHDPRRKLILGFMVSAMDGDTFLCEDLFGKQWTIRLDGVDAPENDQPYGLDARNALRRKLLNRTCHIEWKERDRYERILGRVYTQARDDSQELTDVTLELTQDGWTWHYTKYSNDRSLARAERIARNAKKGLWSSDVPISPWDWRNGAREPAPQPAPSIRTIDTTVYITRTGEKYHASGCRYLKKSKIAIPLSRAKSAYDACKVCSPPG